MSLVPGPLAGESRLSFSGSMGIPRSFSSTLLGFMRQTENSGHSLPHYSLGPEVPHSFASSASFGDFSHLFCMLHPGFPVLSQKNREKDFCFNFHQVEIHACSVKILFRAHVSWLSLER